MWKSACVGWYSSIIELKNARWNIEIPTRTIFTVPYVVETRILFSDLKIIKKVRNLRFITASFPWEVRPELGALAKECSCPWTALSCKLRHFNPPNPTKYSPMTRRHTSRRLNFLSSYRQGVSTLLSLFHLHQSVTQMFIELGNFFFVYIKNKICLSVEWLCYQNL